MLGKIAVAFMTFIIVISAGMLCENDDDANASFTIIASLIVAVLATVVLAQNGVV